MQLVEIRDLDGPNILLLEPAIKLELALVEQGELASIARRLRAALGAPDTEPASGLDAIGGLVRRWLAGLGQHVGVDVRWLETPLHLAIGFGWSHRRVAVATAEALARIVSTDAYDASDDMARLDRLAASTDDDDRPLMVGDADRRVPVIGITGTNGKTTTTRLLAHMLMRAGRRVGWSSSSGVYIDGREVLTGDYSGPSGARRVLQDEQVDVAVLETARGGILLRGVAYESNDVSVFVNVSADHLDLQGIRTVRGLAQTKAVVVRVTRAAGTAVLNADDELVMAATADAAAGKLLFARDGANPTLAVHAANGGRAVYLAGNAITYYDGFTEQVIAPLVDMPMTFGGRASHMVENAMAATGAALAVGLVPVQVADGLRSFRNASDQNLGRLNVFALDGVTVILDYAHNEAGAERLLAFARSFVAEGGKLTMVIGTAGDRTNDSLRGIARIAGAGADRVVIKLTRRYLRGRDEQDLIAQYQTGLLAAGRGGAPVAATELEGLQLALNGTQQGDVVAIMAQDQLAEITAWLRASGASER